MSFQSMPPHPSLVNPPLGWWVGPDMPEPPALVPNALEGRVTPADLRGRELLRIFADMVQRSEKITSAVGPDGFIALEAVIAETFSSTEKHSPESEGFLKVVEKFNKIYRAPAWGETGMTRKEYRHALLSEFNTLFKGFRDLSTQERSPSRRDIKWIWMYSDRVHNFSYLLSRKYKENPNIRILEEINDSLTSPATADHSYGTRQWIRQFKAGVENFTNFCTATYELMVDFQELMDGNGVPKPYTNRDHVSKKDLDLPSVPPSINKQNKGVLLGQLREIVGVLKQELSWVYDPVPLEKALHDFPDSEEKIAILENMESVWVAFDSSAWEQDVSFKRMTEQLSQDLLDLSRGLDDLSKGRKLSAGDIEWIWQYIERLQFSSNKILNHNALKKIQKEFNSFWDGLKELGYDRSKGRLSDLKHIYIADPSKKDLCDLLSSVIGWVVDFQTNLGELVLTAGSLKKKLERASSVMSDSGFSSPTLQAGRTSAIGLLHLTPHRGVLSPRPPSVSSMRRPPSAAADEAPPRTPSAPPVMKFLDDPARVSRSRSVTPSSQVGLSKRTFAKPLASRHFNGVIEEAAGAASDNDDELAVFGQEFSPDFE